MVYPIAPRLQTCTACTVLNTVGIVTQWYYNIIILWDHRLMCGPSLTEPSLLGAYLYFIRMSALL